MTLKSVNTWPLEIRIPFTNFCQSVLYSYGMGDKKGLNIYRTKLKLLSAIFFQQALVKKKNLQQEKVCDLEYHKHVPLCSTIHRKCQNNSL